MQIAPEVKKALDAAKKNAVVGVPPSDSLDFSGQHSSIADISRTS